MTVFRQRKVGHDDFRVWNGQLISYAGYKNQDGTIRGDPASLEFTQVLNYLILMEFEDWTVNYSKKVCQKLGWVGAGTEFDILPLVLQAAGSPLPKVFTIPPELVLQVALHHPKYFTIKMKLKNNKIII